MYNAESFLSYFNKVGCHACLISPKENPEIIDHLDIVVIPGGPDINPSFYGQVPHRKTYFEKNGLRDKFEKTMIERAMDKRKPIFAVCRGLQIVNVVLGGTLHQHLPDRFSEINHRSSKGPMTYTHKVKTSGWLAELTDKEINVNSWHHQGIDVLAPRLKPLAWSEDGIIEAFESGLNASPLLAIQWHPEILQDEESIKILDYFVRNYVK